jgi:hypothetical protein
MLLKITIYVGLYEVFKTYSSILMLLLAKYFRWCSALCLKPREMLLLMRFNVVKRNISRYQLWRNMTEVFWYVWVTSCYYLRNIWNCWIGYTIWPGLGQFTLNKPVYERRKLTQTRLCKYNLFNNFKYSL